MRQNGELRIDYFLERRGITHFTDEKRQPVPGEGKKVEKSGEYCPAPMPLPIPTFIDQTLDRRRGFADGAIETPDLSFLPGEFPYHIGDEFLAFTKKIDPMGREGDLKSRIHEKRLGGFVRLQSQFPAQTAKGLLFTKTGKGHRIYRKHISGVTVFHFLVPFGDQKRFMTIAGGYHGGYQ
jgi:hypothetical protein